MSACDYCKEPLLPTDPVSRVPQVHLHWECNFRLVAGSVAHQQRRCSCFVDGSEESDPPGMTLREAAWAAMTLWQREHA